MNEFQAALVALARRRPVYHSEADLQHELAWSLRESAVFEEVRLERPYRVADELHRVDIVGRKSGSWFAVEVKYWTARANCEHAGEPFELVNRAAHDLGRYDFWRDVGRVERLVAAGVVVGGAVLAVTNDQQYQHPGRDGVIDAEFRMPQGRRVTGVLRWAPGAGEGTKRSREEPIRLGGTYQVTWQRWPAAPIAGTMHFCMLGAGSPLP